MPAIQRPIGRRAILAGAAGAAAAVSLPRSGAAWRPQRPVNLVVTFAPGGATDTHMRVFAEAAGKVLGQPVTIENKTGAGGTLGAIHVKNQRPDGHQLTLMPITVFRYQHLQSVPYDAMQDFTYIIHLTGYTFGVAVRGNSPHRTWADLLADIRRRPGQVSYATPGANTSLHVTMEELARKEGIELIHVPYRGDAEQAQALLGGHVDFIAASTGIAPLVDDGRLRLLNVWTPERRKRWPDVPTLLELGYGLSSTSPYGIAGPKGMDPAAVAALHDAFKTALMDPAHLAVLERQDMPVLYMDSAAYTAFAREQFEKERELVKRLGLKG